MPDNESVKKIILDINDKMTYAANDKVHGADIYRSFCADTLLAVYDNEFSTSPTGVSRYLFGLRDKPHDFTFMLFGNTAVLSYLQHFFEPFDKDTLNHYLRVTKTFVLVNGEWKMIEVSDALQPVNYFIPVSKINTLDSSYAGIYRWTEGLYDTLLVKEGKLYSANGTDQPDLNFPVEDSSFMVKNDFGRKFFHRDQKGRIISYTYLKQDGQKVLVMKMK